MDRAVFIHNTLRDFVSHLCFRVADDNIIVRHQKSVGDLTLCAERFTGTRSAEDQAVGVFQLLPVHHDKVVGQGIQPVIQAFFSTLIKFLRGERNENCRAACGQPSLNLDLAVCQRQATHQPLLLLEIQPAQVAVVFLSDGAGLKDVIFQFLLRASGVQHQKSDEEHSLILALQLFEQGFRIPSVSCQI